MRVELHLLVVVVIVVTGLLVDGVNAYRPTSEGPEAMTAKRPLTFVESVATIRE